MRSVVLQNLTAFAFLAFFVQAQTPAYKGDLLLEPGLNTGKCLTAASNTDGAIVTIQPCNGGASQKWNFNSGNVKVFGNKCLDVTKGQNVDGTKLQIWSCGGNNPNQAWNYDKWSNHLTWVNKNKCVDLTGGSLADGNRIQIWTCFGGNINQVWNSGYPINQLPYQSQDGQYGTNNCGTTSSQSSNCQTAWLNSASDFCIWAPPYKAYVGDTERIAVAYCTKSGRGSRTIPNGALKGVHFVKTPEYVQVTGVGDFTKINVPQGDAGGEIDNRGADGKGNPIGGLVYGNSFGNGQQYHEWTSFISDGEFCFRACVGPRATQLCNHIYDIMGCYWNIPANYNANQYENCQGNAAEPMGVYGTSTWYQGVKPTPGPHSPPASYNCQPIASVTVGPAMARRDEMVIKRHPVGFPVAFPGHTPAPLA